MLIYDDLFGHHDKVATAIQRIKMYNPLELGFDKPYYVCYSGGKDSDCIRILMELSGLTFDLVHNHTLCNDWEWFVTLTLNKDKQDRYAIDGYVRDLGVWIGNYNKKFGVKLRYVLIPEQHKDGAWHMHGLFHDVAEYSVIRNSHGYWDLPYYSARFGYISLSQIQDKEKTSSYITKYISKDLNCTDIKKHKHLFYSSRGLKGAELVSEGECVSLPKGVWTNDYFGIEWLPSLDELQGRLLELGHQWGISDFVPLGE